VTDTIFFIKAIITKQIAITSDLHNTIMSRASQNLKDAHNQKKKEKDRTRRMDQQTSKNYHHQRPQPDYRKDFSKTMPTRRQ
jgi:hypothetical protein